ncbi:MAG TPA: hypothetical protein VM639_14395 [Dongiaceae bacterium]|nr:hypothetical protein [Dongiaceae bacterium]
MISLTETRFALRGLLRILRFDSSFVQFYDRSRDGALRSFWLAAPLLVIFLLRLYLLHDPQQPPVTLRMSAAMIIAYAINWAYFPLFLLWIARYIDREKRVIGCIAVYNWLSILAVFTSLPLSLLGWVGLDAGFLQALDIVSVILSLVCEGYILAVCLQISGFFAAAFVILDLILNQILFTLADHLGMAPIF